MIKNTLILTGPGGIGKGPLANLIRDDAVAIDPYRLRPDGPRRKSDDPLYAHPKLRTELHSILSSFGDSARNIQRESNEAMEWFAKAKVLFFTVRGQWQCLIFHGLDGDIAKAELYAPALPAMLGIAEIEDVMGVPGVLVLNPASTSLSNMQDWRELEEKTRENCTLRGDPQESVQKRVDFITVEAPAWRKLVVEQGAIELTDWPFPEYRYKPENKSQLLRDARKFILGQAPDLEVFFKSELEI